MNVYVRELVSSLAQAGVALHGLRPPLARRPARRRRRRAGFRVVHVDAGPLDLPKEKLPEVVDEFTDGVLADTCGHGRRRRHPRQLLAVGRGRPPAQARARPAARVDLPHAGPGQGRDRRPRAASAGSRPRPRSSAAPTPSSRPARPRPTSSCGSTAPTPERIEIVPPGVDHAFFSPGDRRGARTALGLGLDDPPVLLFVGRIQPLKGLDVAVGALAELRRPRRAAGRRRRAERRRRARPRRRRLDGWSTSSASPTGSASSTAAAPPPAVDLLPGRRRVPRAEPVRVLRAGRPRGRGLRHPGRGGRGRRAAHARRPRAHRLPGRGAATPAAFAARRRRAPRRPGAGRGDGRCRGRRGPAATPGRPPRRRLRRLYADLTARGQLRRLHAVTARSRARRRRRARRARGAHRRLAGERSWPTTRRSPRSTASEPGERRWFVRLRGEQKDMFTIWFTLGQRTLHYETYVMPAPEENHARVLRAPAAPQPQALRRRLRHRRRGRGVPRRPARRRAPSTRTSSTASSARSTPTSSSSSAPPAHRLRLPRSRAERSSRRLPLHFMCFLIYRCAGRRPGRRRGRAASGKGASTCPGRSGPSRAPPTRPLGCRP